MTKPKQATKQDAKVPFFAQLGERKPLRVRSALKAGVERNKK